ncbi:hypothetical protein SNE40_017017 [Patella caerulea]|uniref:Ribosomal RNA-processing protein 43 n=1 Tax=Patella caerulea TaxID=87958 RepID=A0AAN8J9L6_PATCE
MANDLKTFQPKEYYRKFLEKDVRPDGRELGECRSTVVNIGSITTAEGSALVKLGNTTVICGIKAELANPKADEPKNGYIVPNVELSPMCSAQFRPGAPGEQAQVLSQFVVDVLQNSECVNLQDLCIVSGKLVWMLQCDMICLDYDGNVADACVLSLVSALKNTCLPKVTVNEETQAIETDDKITNNLKVQTTPVSTTFAIFDDHFVIVDPTIEEETLATGIITIVTKEKKLCMVHKPGGTPLKDSQIQLCIDRAIERSGQATKLIDETQCSLDR